MYSGAPLAGKNFCYVAKPIRAAARALKNKTTHRRITCALRFKIAKPLTCKTLQRRDLPAKRLVKSWTAAACKNSPPSNKIRARITTVKASAIKRGLAAQFKQGHANLSTLAGLCKLLIYLQ